MKPDIGTTVSRVRGVLEPRLSHHFWNLNKRLWSSLPTRARDSRLCRAYGRWLHRAVCRRTDREMYLGTFFLRNRPALELMRRLAEEEAPGSTLRMAVLGCSIGAEVYSIMWTLRQARPDLNIDVSAVDIATEVVRVGEDGIYGPQTSELVSASIFDRLTESERREMFDWDEGQGRIKPWLREGIMWRVGDACDPTIVDVLGLQDVIVANNFLCHMEPADAERCLRNVAGLMRPGGYIFVSGVDLDVRTTVALELGWDPVTELRSEIHDGDPVVRADWPWQWWGLEPLDPRRRDWQIRYASAFRVPVSELGEQGEVQGATGQIAREAP